MGPTEACPKRKNNSWAIQGHYKGRKKRRRTRKTIDEKTGKEKRRGEGIMANLEYLDLGDEGRGNMDGLFF